MVSNTISLSCGVWAYLVLFLTNALNTQQCLSVYRNFVIPYSSMFFETFFSKLYMLCHSVFSVATNRGVLNRLKFLNVHFEALSVCMI